MVIPYVKGLTESVTRVMKQHGISTAVKPLKTVRNYLVRPKDKREKGETSEVVYEIPCKNCDKSYIGETKRRLDVRISEHKKETEEQTSSHAQFTRATRKSSVTEIHKSAVCEHAVKENHVIDWDNVQIVDKEHDRNTR